MLLYPWTIFLMRKPNLFSYEWFSVFNLSSMIWVLFTHFTMPSCSLHTKGSGAQRGYIPCLKGHVHVLSKKSESHLESRLPDWKLVFLLLWQGTLSLLLLAWLSWYRQPTPYTCSPSPSALLGTLPQMLGCIHSAPWCPDLGCNTAQLSILY